MAQAGASSVVVLDHVDGSLAVWSVQDTTWTQALSQWEAIPGQEWLFVTLTGADGSRRHGAIWDQPDAAGGGARRLLAMSHGPAFGLLRCALERFADGGPPLSRRSRSFGDAGAAATSAPAETQCDAEAAAALSCLCGEALVKVWAGILLEARIVLRSSRAERLAPLAAALVRCAAPLPYVHIVAPVLPSAEAIDVFDAPVPYLVGATPRDRAEWRSRRDQADDDDDGTFEDELCNDEVIVVDVDAGAVRLPPAFDSLWRTLMPRAGEAKLARSLFLGGSDSRSAVERAEGAIAALAAATLAILAPRHAVGAEASVVERGSLHEVTLVDGFVLTGALEWVGVAQCRVELDEVGLWLYASDLDGLAAQLPAAWLPLVDLESVSPLDARRLELHVAEGSDGWCVEKHVTALVLAAPTDDDARSWATVLEAAALQARAAATAASTAALVPAPADEATTLRISPWAAAGAPARAVSPTTLLRDAVVRTQGTRRLFELELREHSAFRPSAASEASTTDVVADGEAEAEQGDERDSRFSFGDLDSPPGGVVRGIVGITFGAAAYGAAAFGAFASYGSGAVASYGAAYGSVYGTAPPERKLVLNAPATAVLQRRTSPASRLLQLRWSLQKLDPCEFIVSLVDRLVATIRLHPAPTLAQQLDLARKSTGFATFEAAAARLADVELPPAASPRALAFFINAHNLVVLHACVARGLPVGAQLGVGSYYSWLRRQKYRLGRFVLTPLQVEHAALRSRGKSLGLISLLLPTFADADARAVLRRPSAPPAALAFSLLAATKSSAPLLVVRSTTLEGIESELRAHAAACIADDLAVLETEKSFSVELPASMRWYAADWGRSDLQIVEAAHQLLHGERRDGRLAGAAGAAADVLDAPAQSRLPRLPLGWDIAPTKVTLRYATYDWAPALPLGFDKSRAGTAAPPAAGVAGPAPAADAAVLADARAADTGTASSDAAASGPDSADDGAASDDDSIDHRDAFDEPLADDDGDLLAESTSEPLSRTTPFPPDDRPAAPRSLSAGHVFALAGSKAPNRMATF
ncbi:hypothetical protein M885DRAFT_590556 [Pelagophyceae sp. CCMP2097]|nr:hypothetical protein M885DRAFT_590556 [Pelagophyceae sp. CCMP2097]